MGKIEFYLVYGSLGRSSEQVWLKLAPLLLLVTVHSTSKSKITFDFEVIFVKKSGEQAECIGNT